MKFEEDGTLTFQKCEYRDLVYFLLQDGEVVYVGKTKTGLARPFSHFDKEYNEIGVLPCERDKLAEVEDFYICKYTPKYNKTKGTKVIRAVSSVKNNFCGSKFSKAERESIYLGALQYLKITPFVDPVSGAECVATEEYSRLDKFIKEITQKA